MRHHGEMVGFVNDGRAVIEQRGRQRVVVEAGESFLIPAGLSHNIINDDDRDAGVPFAPYSCWF